jgi:hypothetical protein
MKVVLTPPVEFALRTMDEDDRLRVQAWIDHLANWETDAIVREHARELDLTSGEEGVYVLQASIEFVVFFKLYQDRIEVLDIASTETIRKSAMISGRGGS